MKKSEFFLLLIILIGAFFVRLYHFNWPVADWHSWRQADTSAVSRNFVKNGFERKKHSLEEVVTLLLPLVFFTLLWIFFFMPSFFSGYTIKNVSSSHLERDFILFVLCFAIIGLFLYFKIRKRSYHSEPSKIRVKSKKSFD